MITAAVILVLSYAGIAFTRLPRVNLDRPSAAFTGAVLMIIFGVLTFKEAAAAIDFHTIALLLGMMVLISAIQEAGLFTLLAVKSVAIAETPRRLLLIVIGSTAVFSAFLVNDAVVLFFTPIILQTCRLMRIKPVPYLIGEAMAANIGSTASVIGNPQNMLIGISSGISFSQFFIYLFPVALASTGVLIGVMYLFYRKELGKPYQPSGETLPKTGIYNIGAIKRVVPILCLTLAAFFMSSVLNTELPVIALAAGAIVLLVSRSRPSRVIRSVDWVLLVFFAGLFVIIEGAHKAGIFDVMLQQVTVTSDDKGIVSLSIFSVFVSQIVSNVPLTMLAIPVVENVPGDVLWIALAASATLGGNMTVIGAVANIIVVESAAREGTGISFIEFLRVGVVVTVLTVGLAVLIIMGEQAAGFLK